MKGIILSGGKATRLMPCTKVISKQLLPVYNRPMIYYPLNTLIKSGIKDILIIVAPDNAGQYMNLLGSGVQFGVKFTYEIQDKPDGLAQALIIGEKFIGDDNVTLILGDNIFEDDFSNEIKSFKSGCNIFVKAVPDPTRFGVVEFDKNNKIISIEEKPLKPKSNYCVTGLYVYDNRSVNIAKLIKPSNRGELEITDVNRWYMNNCELNYNKIEGEWFDAGTFDSLLEANIFAKRKMFNKLII